MKSRWFVNFEGNRPVAISQADRLICSACFKETQPKFQFWEESGVKYGRYVPQYTCPHCGSIMIID